MLYDRDVFAFDNSSFFLKYIAALSSDLTSVTANISVHNTLGLQPMIMQASISLYGWPRPFDKKANFYGDINLDTLITQRMTHLKKKCLSVLAVVSNCVNRRILIN